MMNLILKSLKIFLIFFAVFIFNLFVLNAPCASAATLGDSDTRVYDYAGLLTDDRFGLLGAGA